MRTWMMLVVLGLVMAGATPAAATTIPASR